VVGSAEIVIPQMLDLAFQPPTVGAVEIGFANRERMP
jgi:hypothetical protein